MPPYGILPAARPDPYAGQNAQAFVKILQTLGNYETLRRKKMLNSDILSIISQGGGVEDIAGVVQAHQQPQFDTGLQGLLQRIAAPFAQAPGAGITDALTAQAIVPPKSPTMSDIRMQEYLKAVTTGDTERADKLLMSSLVTIQTGEKLLTSEQRQLLADKGFAEEMGMSEAQRNTARKSVKTIISEMSTRTWTWGTKNYARGNLIQGYKQYQTENDYASKSAENRKWLDKNWDDQMTTYNKAGYKKIGKNEFDWDPKDPKVQKLRRDYDYEAARKAGFGPDETGHWPSQFKEEGSPEQFVDGLDTKTASLEDVIATYTSLARKELGIGATPAQIAERAKKLAKSKGWKIE